MSGEDTRWRAGSFGARMVDVGPIVRCCLHRGRGSTALSLILSGSAKFESTWRDTISVLVARGRAQVGVHSAKSDWSRRILDFAYMDYDDQAAHHE